MKPDIQKHLSPYLSSAKKVVYNRGQLIKSSGTRDFNIYYIKTGCVRIYEIIDDIDITIRIGYKDDFVADLASVFKGMATPLMIEAIRKVEIIVLPYQDIFTSDNLTFINHILQDLVLKQMEREKDLLIEDAVKRYERVLERSPRLFQEVPAKYIASYLRMTPETLSRIKANY